MAANYQNKTTNAFCHWQQTIFCHWQPTTKQQHILSMATNFQNDSIIRQWQQTFKTTAYFVNGTKTMRPWILCARDNFSELWLMHFVNGKKLLNNYLLQCILASQSKDEAKTSLKHPSTRHVLTNASQKWTVKPVMNACCVAGFAVFVLHNDTATDVV